MEFGDDVDIAKELAAAETVVEAPVVEQEPVIEAEVEAVETPETPVEQPTEKKGDVNVALRQARQEAKEAKRALERVSADTASQLAALRAEMAAIKNPPQPKPEFETDPANHLRDRLETVEKATEQTAQQNQQAQIEARVSNSLTASEAEFSKEHPDYSEATSHFLAVMGKNMELLGVNPAQRNAAMRQEVLRLTATALQAGREPAELIYELAKNSGYTGKKTPTVKVEDKLETIENGQKASQSLGSGSRADAGKLTLDSLAKMDDDDFNSLVLDDKKWKEVGRLMQ